MPNLFDSKLFNGEVFQQYVDRIPKTRRNELIKSRAIRPRPELASVMSDSVGGNYITTPLTGLISGSAPQNYDGNTDINAQSTKTFSHSRVVVGRSNAWTEKDFSYDITGGEDFMENVAQQVSDYWEDVDQDTIVHILNGVFNMTSTKGKEFVTAHTYDVTEKVNSEGVTGNMDGTTLNTGMQRACGDNKSKFSLAIMHSAVATNLENLKLLAYLKYTDSEGMQRDLAIGTLNGRIVLVDDNMPAEEVTTEETSEGAGDGETYTAYTTYVLGDGAIEYTDCGAKVPSEMYRDPKTNGGQDTLYSRQRKSFAPYGISFTKSSMASLSPTDTELENGKNWELVNSNEGNKSEYIEHKAIPIARIISRG
jgi:hypothetical protein